MGEQVYHVNVEQLEHIHLKLCELEPEVTKISVEVVGTALLAAYLAGYDVGRLHPRYGKN